MNKLLLSLAFIALFGFSTAEAITIWWKPYKPSRREVLVKKTKSFFEHRFTLCSLSGVIGAGAILAWQRYKNLPAGQRIIVNN